MSQPDRRLAGRRARAGPGLAALGLVAASSLDPGADGVGGFLEMEEEPLVAGEETLVRLAVVPLAGLLEMLEEDLSRPECGGPEGSSGSTALGTSGTEGEGGGGAEGWIGPLGGRDPWHGLALVGRGDGAWFGGKVGAIGREGMDGDEGGGGERSLAC